MEEPLDLRTGINACIEAYKSKHKNSFPKYVFVSEYSYLKLEEEKLLIPAAESSEIYLDHKSSERIEIHLIKNLPEKIRSELEKIIENMKVPMILSKSQKPGEKDIFADLVLSTQELERKFTETSAQ